MLKNAQRSFWALDLSAPVDFARPDSNLVRLDLDVAERHGMLWPVASTYSPQDDSVVDGLSREGVRLVTCAPLLKGHVGPFAEPIQLLIDLGVRGLSGPVEIEFAMNLEPEPDEPREFAFLQIRPLPVVDMGDERGLAGFDPAEVLVRSGNALGHGRIADVRDGGRPSRRVPARAHDPGGGGGRPHEQSVWSPRGDRIFDRARSLGLVDRWLGIQCGLNLGRARDPEGDSNVVVERARTAARTGELRGRLLPRQRATGLPRRRLAGRSRPTRRRAGSGICGWRIRSKC
jgi:hypothetical protein